MFHLTMSASEGFESLFLGWCFWVNVFFDGIGSEAVLLVFRNLSPMG